MDIYEKMGSAQGREEIKQEIDTVEILLLADQIRGKALEASVVAKKLQEEDIPEGEKEHLGEELKRLVAEGAEITSRKAHVESRYL